MKHLIKLIGILAFGTAVFMISATSHAAPAAKAHCVKKQDVKKSTKPVKKEDGKIKPLDPDRKVPTLKKKYRKED